MFPVGKIGVNAAVNVVNGCDVGARVQHVSQYVNRTEVFLQTTELYCHKRAEHVFVSLINTTNSRS